MRHYCYTNGVDVTDGVADSHSPPKFEFNISAGQVSPYTPSGPLPQLIGEFVDSVLITQRLEYTSQSVVMQAYS